MYTRLITPPRAKSFFLFGPRGTGKSSWVKQTLPEALYIDLLESGTFNDLLAAPQRLENLIPVGFADWIILDEVQRIPELLNEVHRLIENKGHRFVLTGSSARKLRRKGVNLLAGRALTYTMHPLTAVELGKDFSLAHSLRFGQLPSVYVETDPQAYLESYVQSYLREEVQQEGLTRNLGAFSRFLEAASFSQGASLNISAVASDCGVDRKLAENYFLILEDLLLAMRIPPFTKRAKRQLVAHPKFYFFDAGLFRTLRPSGPLDSPEEAEGPATETLVLQDLIAINATLKLGYAIYYWRTTHDVEVDFVLYGPKGLIAIEVKRTGRLRSEYFRGLKAFASDYPKSKLLFIYGGQRRLSQGNIDIIPIQDFLKNLPRFLSG